MFYDFGTPVSPDVLLALKREIFSSLHVALPGFVESFDPETRTASVRPALRRRAGPAGEPPSLPILREVPVFFPAFSDPSISIVIQPGDPCLLIFADANIDGWMETGSNPLPPSDRQHDLSDAFAFVGFHTRKE